MAVALVLGAASLAGAAEAILDVPPRVRRPLRIGIVLDGEWQRGHEIRSLVETEITDLLQDEFAVRFPPPLEGDWTAAGVRRVVDRALGDPELDVVIGLGILASSDLCHRTVLPKPAIAPFVLDPLVQGIPFADGASGMTNLSYVASGADLSLDLSVYRSLVPFDRMLGLGFEHLTAIAPEIEGLAAEQAAALGFEIRFRSLGDSVDATLAAIPPDVDAVLLGLLFQLAPEEFTALVRGLTARRLPTFTVISAAEVEQGVFATVSPEEDISRVARRVALNVQSIALGEDAGTLPVALSQRQRLTINMATARALGISPRWDVLNEAVLLFEEPPAAPGRQLSLVAAAGEAVAANLDLRVAEREVAAGAALVRRTRAELLPQVSGRTTSVFIDDDRANVLQRERTTTGAVGLSQLLYADGAWADYQIERQNQRTREEDYESVRLDIVRDAAVAYLNVLRDKALQRIAKENLSLTRSNLELAQVRVNVGVSDRSDVYRWESEIANDRQDVIRADTTRRQSEISLNRLIHRPLEERFETEETGIDDPGLLVNRDEISRYVDRPATFTVFRDFAVADGLERAPELRGIDAAITAQERARSAARRAFWLPTFTLDAEYADRMQTDGDGAGGLGALGPGTLPDDQDWTVALEARLPLFTSGARHADLGRASELLARLRHLRAATAERIEQDIRSSLLQAQSSFANIRLAEESAEAARKNLELITDSYSRGAVDIITLLDAQNASLVADQAAATAVFTFLADWMNTQRALSRFDFMMSEAEQEKLLTDLAAYFADAGVAPAP